MSSKALIIQVKVKPGARASELVASEVGPWNAQIKSPPVYGKANAELIALFAQHFKCARSAVRVKAGAGGRMKLVEVDLA